MSHTPDEMRKALKDAHESNPELFRSIVKEILNPAPHPRARAGRQTKRTKAVFQSVWAKVEFLKWRDGGSVVSACKRLEYHGGFDFNQFDTEDHKWRPASEPEPDRFEYSLADWQGIKRAYYDYWNEDANTESFGKIRLDQMKAAHCGETSIIDRDWLAKHLPPPK